MADTLPYEIPPSFLGLYQRRGRLRPGVTAREVAAHYEACEDLAQALTEQARERQFSLGVTEADVLVRMHRGLAQPESGLSLAQAWWVTHRLAELLGWPCPLPDTPPEDPSDA